MQTRPPPHKKTHLKHRKTGDKGSEALWLRRYWIVLASITLLSVSLIVYNSFSVDETEQEPDVYVSVQTRTLAGDRNNVLCKLSLQVAPEQEKGIQERRALLESVVNSVLSEAYMGQRRPSPAEVRAQLLTTLNQKLPKKLQLRDVLLQELVIGSS